MRSRCRLVLLVVLAGGLLGSAVYVGWERLQPAEGGLSAGGPVGAAPSGVDEPIPLPPGQRGWVSPLAPGSSVGPVSGEGGVAGDAGPPVPVTPVNPASEDVALLDGSGSAAGVVERIDGSPVTVEVLDVDGVRVSALQSPVLEVAVVDDDAAGSAGLDKVAFTLGVVGLDGSGLADGLSSVEAAAVLGGVDVRVSVDYSAFVDEFGGNWAGRLRLVEFAPCALSPGVARCDGPRVVDGFVNDTVSQVVSVTLPLDRLAGTDLGVADMSPPESASTSAPESESQSASPSSGSVSGFGLMAGASSSSGDYGSTSLNAAGSWSVGTQSGNFSWSYPVSLAAPPAGSAPGLAVSYSAQAIDGLTADENTQGGVLGPGWSLGDGFIERQYLPCAADSGVLADQCWVTDNATFSFGGMNSELVRVGTESSGLSGWETVVYRLEDHSGWIVKRYGRLDQSARGGLGVDNNGEYWVAIAPDGTRYLFGYGTEANTAGAPGTVLKSVQTVPVLGNHSGEPCNAQAQNWCHQAYRWSLDRIEDASGRVTSFHYAQEVNYYGLRGSPGVPVAYVTAAAVARIEYGQLIGSAAVANWYTHAVEFTYHYRCNNPEADLVCRTAPTSSTGSSFPDVPVDQFCPSSYCTNYAPTFYTRYMLRSIMARVRDTTGAMIDVGEDVFGVAWVDPDGAGSDPPRLWLDTIQHAGRQDGVVAWMPPVRFFESPGLANRVDYNEAGGVTRMRYYRVGAIVDEYGSEIRVAYTQPKPCPSPFPNPPPAGFSSFTNNTWACFQRFWVPPTGPAGPSVWHKYVVDSVTVVDQSSPQGSNSRLFDYQYPDVAGANGAMAWHSDSNPLVPVARRYWAEFRGFERVRVVTGYQNEPNRTITDHTFFRGMDNDINSHSNPNGVARDNEVTESSLGSVDDAEYFHGRQHEVVVRNVVNGAAGTDVYSGDVTYYAVWSTVGSDATSYQVDVSTVRHRESYGGVATYGRVDYTYDTHPWTRRLIKVIDYGRATSAYGNELGADGVRDDSCTTMSYTPASAAGGRFLNGLAHREVFYGFSDCATNLLSDTRTFYDETTVSAVANPAAPTSAPQYGNPTALWRATGANSVTDDVTGSYVPAVVERTHFGNTGYSPSPSWGRVATTTDARGHVTSYTYTPFSSTVAAFGAKTMTVQNPLGHSATTEFDIYGNQIRTTDPNGRNSYVCHDMFGRVSKVYEPGVPGGATCTQSPSLTFAYDVVMVTGNIAAPAAVPRWAMQTRQLFALDADSFNPMQTGDSYLESWTMFDGFGRPTQAHVPSPIGGRIVTRTVYDSQDNPIRVSQPFWSSLPPGDQWTDTSDPTAITAETLTRFDPLGRPLRVEELVTNVVVRTASTTSYTPDRTTINAATEPGSPAYASTVNWSDADAKVWQVTENDNYGADRNTRYRYDQAGQLTSIVDADANTTNLSYNLLGWRTWLNDPNAGYSDTRFYETGQIRLTVDARNQTIYTRIDELGRPTATHTATTPTTANQLAAYDYDGITGGIGTLTRADSMWPAGTLTSTTETLGFDPAGRPTASRITVPAANGPDPDDNALAGPHSITTAYTRNGVAYQQTYPGVAGSNQTFTETVVTGFNSHGQPITLGATVGAPYTEEVLYDAVGRAARTTMGPAGSQAGLFITAAWNTDGRLYRQRAETRIGQEIQDDIYTYDAAGNPLQISHDQMWSGSDETECFQYDDRQRLTRSFTLNGLSACPAQGQPINPAGPNPYYELHSVDHLGRIFHLDGTNRTHGATTPTGCRTSTQPTKPHALTTATAPTRTDTYSYDCNGAVTQQTTTGTNPATVTHTWDHQQRLRATTTPDGTTTNTYDTTNNRVLRVDPDGTRTVYLPNTEIRWNTTTATQVARTYGQTRREFDGTLTRFAVNHQGSIVATTNTDATSPQNIRYTPYGNNRATTADGDNLDDRNFLNQPDDPNTPTNYLNNRHYQPNQAIFISVDPIAVAAQPATLNPFIYSQANPITLNDRTGLRPDTDNQNDLDAWFKNQRNTFHSRHVSSHESYQRKNRERAEGIRYWANCSGDFGSITFTGACSGADLLESGAGWSEIQPYLVGLDPGSQVFQSEPERALLAFANAGMVAAYEETGFLPDYFVLDAEAITQWGWGVGGLAVITRTGTLYLGIQGNLGEPGISVAGRAGYLAQPASGWTPADGDQVDAAIAGLSFSASVTVSGLPGFSRSVVYGVSIEGGIPHLSGAASVEAGIGMSGPVPFTYSMSVSYLWQVWTIEGLSW